MFIFNFLREVITTCSRPLKKEKKMKNSSLTPSLHSLNDGLNLRFSFHHIEPTDSIKAMIEKKVKKLEKFLIDGGDIHWTCEIKSNQHHSHVSISARGVQVFASSLKDDLYTTFDDIIHKLEKQLSKMKEKNDPFHHHIEKSSEEFRQILGQE
jgi:ribosomal subunit interface protein